MASKNARGLALMIAIASLALAAAARALAARLWDVASDGMQTLVARELYRPSANGASSS